MSFPNPAEILQTINIGIWCESDIVSFANCEALLTPEQLTYPDAVLQSHRTKRPDTTIDCQKEQSTKCNLLQLLHRQSYLSERIMNKSRAYRSSWVVLFCHRKSRN